MHFPSLMNRCLILMSRFLMNFLIHRYFRFPSRFRFLNRFRFPSRPGYLNRCPGLRRLLLYQSYRHQHLQHRLNLLRLQLS